MKLALVGTGYWGSKLLRNLVSLRGAHDIIAVDGNLDRLAAACSDYPAVRACRTLDEALDDPEVEGVVIATPVESHAELIEQVLLADRDVLVEKPFTTSVTDAVALIELADARERVLMVGHTFLFSPRVQWIADFLTAGRLGQIHYITSSRLNLGLHRPDANVIWDLAPHDFAVLFHLLGELPLTVAASARSVVRRGLPDVAFMDLTFESGIIASVMVSWFAPRKIRNLMLVGDTTMLVYDDTDAEEPVKVHDRGVVLPDPADFGVHQLTYRYGDTTAPHIAVLEPLAHQLEHFIDAIERRVSPRSDGRFGLGVVAALAAADESWQSGGAPVTVSLRTGSLVP